MSARRFEVSFRAELDDRQVDALADTLFEMGYDDLCFRPLAEPPQPRLIYSKICADCGDRYLNWGAHAERCYGRGRVVPTTYNTYEDAS